MAITFEDAPDTASAPGRRAGGKFGDDAQALRQAPGKEARLDKVFPSRESARNFAGSVNRGKRKGFEPAGAFTTKVGPHPVEADSFAVWVTYVGDDEPDAE